jgi:Raf kinase inhibitor-like YbhB/YbcL family protein
MAFELLSPAFQEGKPIPRKYTCDGPDISVPLRWHGPPDGTKSFALIADDPDAPRGTWVHWVMYDLPPDIEEIPESIPGDEVLDNGAKQGKNDFGNIGYGGPCPPPGSPHRYYFKLYALDRWTGLKPKATKQQLVAAMKGHVLAEAHFTGTYKR